MNDVVRMRLLLGAAMLFALLVVPVALAGASGDSGGGPQANASASTNKKIKKLTTRVSDLEQQLAELQGEQGGARRPPGRPAATSPAATRIP